jgi:hypothetical protein
MKEKTYLKLEKNDLVSIEGVNPSQHITEGTITELLEDAYRRGFQHGFVLPYYTQGKEPPKKYLIGDLVIEKKIKYLFNSFSEAKKLMEKD